MEFLLPGRGGDQRSDGRRSYGKYLTPLRPPFVPCEVTQKPPEWACPFPAGATRITIHKFCTMTDERDEGGNLLPDGERLTRLGQFLRKTSIDPQITQIKKKFGSM